MKTYIGHFSRYTSFKVVNGNKEDTVTPISFTVCIGDESLEEAIEVLRDYRIEDTKQGYEPEFEEILFGWNSYTLQAVTESLY